jgi:hypothetical protein
MGQVDWIGEIAGSVEHEAGRTQVEITVSQAAALLAAALVGGLRVADAVLEAWPLPTSRARRTK